MSAHNGRLTPGEPPSGLSRISYYDHALRLAAATPEEPLPDGGAPYPDGATRRRRKSGRRGERSDGRREEQGDGRREQQGDGQGNVKPRPVEERTAAVGLHSVLEGLFEPGSDASAATVDALFGPLDVTPRQVTRTAADLVPRPDAGRSRQIGLGLVRYGTDRRTVNLGLALLTDTARAEDAPLIRTVGLLRPCGLSAVAALASLDDPGADLVWMAGRLEGRQRIAAVRALTESGATADRWGLLCGEFDAGWTVASRAREIAEALDLPGALRETEDVRVRATAAQLLIAITALNDYRAQIPEYAPAREVCLALSRCATSLTGTVAHQAPLASLLLDVHSGPSHLLDWAPGEREEVCARLREALRSAPAPLPEGHPKSAAWRAEWLRGVVRGSGPGPGPGSGMGSGSDWGPGPGPGQGVAALGEAGEGRSAFRVEVAVHDPGRTIGVETRVLVDGRPLIAELFPYGPPHMPEKLLGRGELRAREEPHEVRLAEAHCTEGCCGALYVTIRREGDVVVWDGWRLPGTPASHEPQRALSALRFGAALYDAEVARAEADHSWEWPARSVARMVAERLRDEPELLGRWDCAPGWIGTHHTERDRVLVSFMYPRRDADKVASGAHRLQFIWSFEADGAPPAEQAEAAARTLAGSDPTSFARLAGGSREAAQALGFAWPEPE
ncbi:hypothetical protein OHB04_18105 [Streptomyces sp. NBC_01775]|uniref:hypothetical protein n=1 Tax=Streptomyces sp. NBC_01775 TaxID=2975939 RepID=UPI002DD8E9D8|nr:hypothetical protein [Streptomyces sp. NBC_01775]WSB77502.1 hypothetical protein OHB04_18105 [Streptomyces sp. NBC_01775]